MKAAVKSAPVPAKSVAKSAPGAAAKPVGASNGKGAAPRVSNGTAERKRPPLENANGSEPRTEAAASDSGPMGAGAARETVVAVAAPAAPRGNPPALPTPIATFTV